MNPEIQDLIDRYVDGSASPEDVRCLDRLVQTDPSVRRALLLAAGMQTHLRRLLSGALPQEAVASGVPNVVVCRDEGVRRRPKPTPDGHSVKTSSIPTLRCFLRYAAIFLLVVSGWATTVIIAARSSSYRARYQMTAVEIEALKQAVAQRAEDAQHANAGQIIGTRGLVLVLPAKGEKAFPIYAGTPVPLGRSLWTCPWGAATMRLPDGVALELDRNSEASLAEDGGTHRVVAKRGIIFVTKQSKQQARTVVNTPDAVVSIDNAQVAIAVEQGRTIIEVAEGEVHVTAISDGRTVVVAESHYLILGGPRPYAVTQGRLAWRLEPAKTF